ncbi:phenylacetate--CoA ligase family protein [Fimbriiglobus ruber]|uniref:Phenylacetate-coenzyme A ligase n=1 Tax=Fimbriiglobus ruber TaxID=1908690 RepID=A0A225DPG8_9BACT|nr:AMP-binding protein [Fimbriiglobus ruber]OWK40488.1 Phenylacetate-coenzyme A ligase [Fimbriiglobus ruber]
MQAHADHGAVQQRQFARLRQLLSDVVPANGFYARKYADLPPVALDVRTPTDLTCLPFTTKAELAADQADHPPYGTNLTNPPESYSRLHQTSGTTTGRPLRWLDTPASWNCLLTCWETNFSLMKLAREDRVFFPFSFGPFLGFWTAFEAASRVGMLTLPGGGMPTTARLRFLLDHEATVVCATPTYAQHLAEVAADEGIDLTSSSVRAIVVAGEPGGSVPGTRERIETAWCARVFDHYGMTEVGPVATECAENPDGMHVLEEDYIAEVVDPATGQPVAPGTDGELVVTNLGRTGSPLIRYRTGDIVRVDTEPCPCGRIWTRLAGGVRGRTDDMIHVRGNNVYPTAIEAVVRRFPEVREFRVIIDQTGPLSDLRIEVEPADAADGPRTADAVARAVRDVLLFRAAVTAVPPGTLPRFEMKARRVVRTPGERGTSVP